MALRQLTLNEFPITPVNPDSPIPLYFQVEADLRELLRSPAVTSGDLLPTELDLAQAYGVGRHTIRTALGRLVSDHLITRKAGHGTVVSASKDRLQFSLAQSFSRQMEDMGLIPRSVVLDKQLSTIGPADPPALQAMAGASCPAWPRTKPACARTTGSSGDAFKAALASAIARSSFDSFR